MTMVKLCGFAPGQDLSLIRDHLEAQGIPYQVREAGGGAELWVDDQHLDMAAAVLDHLVRRDPSASSSSRRILAKAFLHTWPITIATMLLGVAGFLLVAFAPGWLGVFTFTEVSLYVSYAMSASFVQTYWVEHQWWRLITPAFLHFGIWHVLFNSMALWELGRRLEFVLPRFIYLTVLGVTGIAANVMQHLLPGSPIFGGLSGVIFGLFGAIAVLYRRTASPVLNLPRGLYILALVSLVILPFVLKTFAIHVANGAHVGGLVAGLVLGAVLPVNLVRRFPEQAPSTYI